MIIYQVKRYHETIYQSNSLEDTRDFLLDFMDQYWSYGRFDVEHAKNAEQLQWATIMSEECYLKIIYPIQGGPFSSFI